MLYELWVNRKLKATHLNTLQWAIKKCFYFIRFDTNCTNSAILFGDISSVTMTAMQGFRVKTVMILIVNDKIIWVNKLIVVFCSAETTSTFIFAAQINGQRIFRQ